MALDSLPENRRQLLRHLKDRPGATIAILAELLKVTTEAVRRQIVALERDGWVVRARGASDGAGRPAGHYRLTAAGEELFPKEYAALSITLVDLVAERLGKDALDQVLVALTDARVAALAPRVTGETLAEKIDSLRDLYGPGDAYVDVETAPGGFHLIERNCPYFKVASERPRICSTTVSVLRRLLGRHVVRHERFQDGDGRCVFYVHADRPADTKPAFLPEPPKDEPAAGADAASVKAVGGQRT